MIESKKYWVDALAECGEIASKVEDILNKQFAVSSDQILHRMAQAILNSVYRKKTIDKWYEDHFAKYR